MLDLPVIFRLRERSIVRGILLCMGAFAGSLLMAGFPHMEQLRGSRWQFAALAACAWGFAETARCLRKKWNLYHAGVLILLYTDLMILAMIAFLAVFP